jgi:Ca2+-binding RTX toxin-like protein
MARINGNNKANTLIGTNLADDIFGYGGNDVMKGKIGSDNLYGGSGNNILEGGGGIGQDNYYLTGYDAKHHQVNADTIVVHRGDSQFHYDANAPIDGGLLGSLGSVINFDRIYNWDKYDRIDLDSANPKFHNHPKVMADITVKHAAHATTHFDGFTVKGGLMTLTHHSAHQLPSHHGNDVEAIKVNTIALAKEAYHFLAANCLPQNLDKVFAIYVDVNIHGPQHTIVLQAHTDTDATAIDVIGHFPHITDQII